MEELDSLWNYQEETMDDMKQKLLFTSLELERLNIEASDEKRKNNELIQLIKLAYRERDEARDHLHKLLNKINQSQINIDSPRATNLPKANSSTIESNSLSDAYNDSSQVESFLDVVSSPHDLVNNNIIPIGHDQVAKIVSSPDLVNNNIIPVSCNVIAHEVIQPKFDDHGSLVIDRLVKGKTLPQHGKFLQAVLETGPLLQTLLVAGPLPRWRNPPQFKPLHIPPVSIKSVEDGMMMMMTTQKSNVQNLSHFGSSLMNNSQPYFEMSCASSQMLSPYLGGPNCNNFVQVDKRQRLQ